MFGALACTLFTSLRVSSPFLHLTDSPAVRSLAHSVHIEIATAVGNGNGNGRLCNHGEEEEEEEVSKKQCKAKQSGRYAEPVTQP